MLEAAQRLDRHLALALEDAVPLGKPGPKTKACWIREITTLKKKLGAAQRWSRENKGDAVAGQERQKKATREWERAIRETQWKFWKEKL